MGDKDKGKGDKPKDENPRKRKRHEVRLVVPLEVKADTQKEAAVAAMQWLLEVLVKAKEPAGLSVFPPEPYRVEPEPRDKAGDAGPGALPPGELDGNDKTHRDGAAERPGGEHRPRY